MAAKLALLSGATMFFIGAALLLMLTILTTDPVSLPGVVSAILLVGAGAISAGLIAYSFLNRYLKQPLRALQTTAANIAAGDIETRFDLSGAQEFADLARVFNRMIDNIVRAQAQTDIDELTGLFNYRHALSYLKTQMGLARRYRRDLAVAVFDIDHLREINDIFGRQVGDEVLKDAAKYVKSQLRQVDYAARCGGEQFLIVMPETRAAPAMAVIERIHACFSDHVFIEQNDAKNYVFISAGVADFPRGGEDETNLLAAANMALLTAKRRGRNQVTYFRTEDKRAS